MKIFKRAASFVLVLAMVLTLLPANISLASSAPEFYVDAVGVEAVAGTSVVLPVKVKNNPGLNAVVLDFEVPAGWAITKLDNRYKPASGALQRGLIWVYDADYDEYSTWGDMQFTAVGNSVTTGRTAWAYASEVEGDGVWFWMTVSIPENIINGDYTIDFSAYEIAAEGSTVDVKDSWVITDCTLTVTGGVSREDMEPQFKAPLTDKSFTYGEAAPTLDATATVVKTDGAVTYQWYKADSAEAEGTAIDGATSATYTPARSSATAYYYCVATNVFGGDTYTAKTAAAKVTANKKTLTLASGNSILDCTVYACRHVYDGEDHGYYAQNLWTGSNSFLALLRNDFTYRYAPVVNGQVGELTAERPVEVGTYNFYVSFAGNEYWEPATDLFCNTFSIKPADITGVSETASATVYVGGAAVALPAIEAVTKGGQTAAVTYTTDSDLIVLDTANKTVKAAGTKTGTATVTATVKAPNHNDFVQTVTVTVEAKQKANVTFEKKGDGVYTGQPQALSTFVNAATADRTGGTVTYTLNGSPVTLADTVTAAGTYELVASYEDDTHAGSAAVTVVIDKASVAVPTAKTGLVYNEQVQTGVVLPEGAKYTLTGNTGKDAGSYTAAASLTDPDNYKWADEAFTGAVAWSIAQAAITVDSTVTKWNYTEPYTYNGQTKTVELTGLDSRLEAAYTGNTGVDAKSYTAKVTITAKDSRNYTVSGSVADLSWEILPQNIDVSGVVFEQSDIEYDGQPHTVAVKGLPANVTVSYTGDAATQTNAATYTTVAALTAAKNYALTGIADNQLTLQWKILPKEIEVPTAKTGLKYTGSEQTGVNYDTAWTYYMPAVTAQAAGTDAGDYEFVVSLRDSDNYVWADGDTSEVKIIPWSIAKGDALALTSAVSHRYSDTAEKTVAAAGIHATAGSIKFTGCTAPVGDSIMSAATVSADGSALTYALNSGLTAADAGKSATFTATFTSDNYVESTVAITVTVMDKNAVAVTFENGSGTYNGQVQTYETATVPEGYEGTITYSYSASMKDAGSYTVTAVYEDADNYGTAQATYVISPAKISVKDGAAVDAKTYDGTKTAQVSGVEFTGLFGEDTVSATVTDAQFNSADVKTAAEVTYTVSIPAGNYVLDDAVGKSAAAIAPKPVTVTVGDIAAATYTGAFITPVPTVDTEDTVGGYALVKDSDYTLAYASNKDAGTAEVTVTAKAGSNYTFAAAKKNFTIDPAALTVTAENLTVDYTGVELTDAAIKGTAKFNGTSVAGTWSWVVKPAGTNASTAPYSAKVQFTPASANYVGPMEKEITVTINQVIPSGEPIYTEINEAGKTLADVELGLGTLPAGGTVIWVDEDGVELPADTKVEANKAYTWQYTPAAADAANYKVATGTIVPYVYHYTTPGVAIYVPNAENGSVTTTTSSLLPGGTVVLVVTPDAGYELESLTVVDQFGASVAVTALSDGRYAFTMPNGIVTVIPVFAKASAARVVFADVAEGIWYYEAVYYAYDNGLMNGVAATLFAPSDKLTRGMLMTVLARLDGVDTSGGTPWYAKGMEWAKAKGVSDGTMPNANITREQAVTMLYRYVGQPAVTQDHLASVVDGAQVSSWAKDAMNWAVSVGLLKGDEAGKLNPAGTATRAEIATMLMRFVENLMG